MAGSWGWLGVPNVADQAVQAVGTRQTWPSGTPVQASCLVRSDRIALQHRCMTGHLGTEGSLPVRVLGPIGFAHRCRVLGTGSHSHKPCPLEPVAIERLHDRLHSSTYPSLVTWGRSSSRSKIEARRQVTRPIHRRTVLPRFMRGHTTSARVVPAPAVNESQLNRGNATVHCFPL